MLAVILEDDEIMRVVTLEDIRDIYLKIIQKGLPFIFSKFSFHGNKRTKSSFNVQNIKSSNWWIIPTIQKRWNKLITDSAGVTYEEYVSEIINNSKSLKMLSIGSGVCSHELRFAELNANWEITCIDFSDKLLELAKKTADKRGFSNISFLCKDIYKYELPDEHYDIILFHSSLHHFRNLEEFIKSKVVNKLKQNGKLIINEYVGVNRLQYRKKQLEAINQSLKLIDSKYRKLFKTKFIKRKYYGSGILRMIIADPSECVESEKILPTIYNYFDIVIEKPYGGNILMPLLKDISHHFVQVNEKKNENLERIIEFEDEYISRNKSDFMFGVYEKKTTANKQ